MMIKTARQVALETLIKVFESQGYSNLSLNSALSKNKLSVKDQNLVTELVYGTIQYQLYLDYQLTGLVKTKLKDRYLRPLLLMSLYQLIFLDKIPNRAVLDEANKLAKIMGRKNSSAFRLVNGILRSFIRRGAILPPKEPLNKYLSIKESMPLWLTDYLLNHWGSKRTEKILTSLNQRSKNCIRINQNASKPQVLNELQKLKINYEESSLSPSCYFVDKPIMRTDLFKSGQVTIQDEAASLVASCFDYHENDEILDACAAPGGKSMQMAENLTNGHVTCLDIHEHKLKLVKNYATRMKLSNKIKTKAVDARKASTYFSEGQFDKILVDAPCSGLGLLRRKPEIRYLKTMDDIKNLAKIQLKILNSVALLLKKNGELVYSTCSITVEENEAVIAEFLKQNPKFEIQAINLPKISSKAGLKILPDTYQSDGFYIAKMKLRG